MQLIQNSEKVSAIGVLNSTTIADDNSRLHQIVKILLNNGSRDWDSKCYTQVYRELRKQENKYYNMRTLRFYGVNKTLDIENITSVLAVLGFDAHVYLTSAITGYVTLNIKRN